LTTQDSLQKEIAKLRLRAAGLELSGEEFRRQIQAALGPLSLVVDRAADSPGYATKAANPLSKQISGAVNPQDPIQKMVADQLRGGMEHASGGFMGYIPCGGLPSAAVADLITSITNKYSAFNFSAPGAAAAENEVIDWMCQLFALGSDAWGCLTSGGTMAMLTCLLAARESVANVPAERLAIYLTDQTHHSAHRSLKAMGLLSAKIRLVATDELLRMDAAELSRAVQEDKRGELLPFLVIASAGTTNTGAIDPLEDIAKVSRGQQLWMHVDAAYGGFFILCEQAKGLFRGIEHADSIAVDQHKGMFLPQGTGASLVRNGEQLKAALHEDADYLPEQGATPPKLERSPGDYSFELTRHNRAPRIKLSLDLYGEEIFAAALSEKLLLARWLFAELSQIRGVLVFCEPQLTVLAFRVSSDAETKRLLGAILQDGKVFVSPTQLRGEFWIRACVLNFRTHIEHVEALLERVKAFQEERARESKAVVQR